MLPSVLAFAHHAIAEVLHEGDVAIDATLGNGHDTLFLANQVGAAGRVIGFDVQVAALAQTRRRLDAHRVADRVMLVHASHETLADHISPSDTVNAIMFNLGYLPGADKSMVTLPQTTLRALKHACEVVAIGGRISVVVYPGHVGGAEEAAAVSGFLQKLDQRSFQVARYGFLNQMNAPPYLFLLEKLKPHHS